MNAKRILFSAILTIGFGGGLACAASEVIPLRPLDLPTITKWVPPTRVPAQFEGSTILVSFVLKTTGEPANLRLVSPRNFELEECLLPAVAQCRFAPVIKDGVAVDTKVVLPMTFELWNERTEAPIQVGALQSVAETSQLAAAAADENTHPAMYHINSVTRGGQMVIADGTEESVVRNALGRPEKLSKNVWAFAKFSGLSEEASHHGCDTLLVSFEDQRVVALALVNDRAKRHVAEALQYDPNYVASRLANLHNAAAMALK